MKEKVKKIVINSDIYDEFGRVYLKKGRSIVLNRENIGILKKLGLLEKVLKDIGNNESTNSKDTMVSVINIIESFENIKENFSKSYTILDEKAFEISSKAIQEILGGSKGMPWKLHLDTLASYADWYYSHSVNTALIASMIGVNLGYENESLENLIVGSLMHDIGMMLIPQDLLQKEGSLSDEEFDIQKKHCELGVAMISSLNLSDTIKNIIMQHHERIDGLGYPLGLKEDNISEEAQIVMIADSFDAGTSHRPYKNSKSEREVGMEISSQHNKYSKKIIDSIKKSLLI